MERALCTESERGPMLREVSGDGRVLEKSQKKPEEEAAEAGLSPCEGEAEG